MTIIAQFDKSTREVIGTSRTAGGRVWFAIRVFNRNDEYPDGLELANSNPGIQVLWSHYERFVRALEDVGEHLGEPDYLADEFKSGQGVLRIGTSKFKEHDLVDIRIYAEYGDPKKLRPTKKGITVKKELYPEILRIVKAIGESDICDRI